MKNTEIVTIFNVKERERGKKILIWISCLLEMDVYFQNIALAASAEAIYRPQRRRRANMCRQTPARVWSYAKTEGVPPGRWAARQREQARRRHGVTLFRDAEGRAGSSRKRAFRSVLRVMCHWHEYNRRNNSSLVFGIDHRGVFLP